MSVTSRIGYVGRGATTPVRTLPWETQPLVARAETLLNLSIDLEKMEVGLRKGASAPYERAISAPLRCLY